MSRTNGKGYPNELYNLEWDLQEIRGKEEVVFLDRSVKPKKLEAAMSAYELKSQGQISRSEYRFMFIFNPEKVKSKKLIQEINDLSFASEAEIPQQLNR